MSAQEPNPVVMVMPANGNPRRQNLSDARVQAPYDHNGVVCNFSGLIAGIATEVPFHNTPFTVDQNNLPKDMPGYWVEEDEEDTSDHNDAWVVDFRVVCDEEGLPKRLPSNQNAPAYVGDVFIVKRLFNTYTWAEVPLDIEVTDLPVVQTTFPNANFTATA
tara:strand:+ start:99 stop:581 length:483 start_codon:yes stop_codon:yes gene_type:complete